MKVHLLTNVYVLQRRWRMHMFNKIYKPQNKLLSIWFGFFFLCAEWMSTLVCFNKNCYTKEQQKIVKQRNRIERILKFVEIGVLWREQHIRNGQMKHILLTCLIAVPLNCRTTLHLTIMTRANNTHWEKETAETPFSTHNQMF